MMGLLVNAIAGFLFGLGLVIGGMSNPAKVLNFLDLAGSWDPSLAFVMAGAVAVTFIGYKLVFRQPRPLIAARFHLPELKQIDRRLVLGAAIFGVGWGLSGFCPGPAITSLPLLAKGTLVFVLAMLGGMIVTRLITNTRLRAKILVSDGTGGRHAY
jgi:uncharacterized protein